MSDNTIFLIMIYLILESFEFFTQKADTLMGMMVRLYERYKRGVHLFVLYHPSYLFSLFLAVYVNFSTEALIVVALKSIDIIVKIRMLEQIFIKKELAEDMALLLLQRINPLFFTLNFLIYLPLVIFSLQPIETFY